LLRAYATEQATIHDSDTQRHHAIRRLLDHYLHTAHAAARLLEPVCDPLKLPPLVNAATPEQITDESAAMQWFVAEHHTLMNIVPQAAGTGHEPHAWQIAWAMVPWSTRRGVSANLATAQRTALEAARRTGDLTGQAHTLVFLGRAVAMLDLHHEAETY